MKTLENKGKQALMLFELPEDSSLGFQEAETKMFLDTFFQDKTMTPQARHDSAAMISAARSIDQLNRKARDISRPLDMLDKFETKLVNLYPEVEAVEDATASIFRSLGEDPE